MPKGEKPPARRKPGRPARQEPTELQRLYGPHTPRGPGERRRPVPDRGVE